METVWIISVSNLLLVNFVLIPIFGFVYGFIVLIHFVKEDKP